MGIYDREYYQDERPAGFNMSAQWSMVAKLVALNVAVFVVDIFMQGGLVRLLSASPETLAKPWLLWQLLTYGFAHDPDQVSHIFWNMFALFMFGRDVEGVYGPKEFLRVYLISIVLCGLVWCGLRFATNDLTAYLIGASGAVTTITLLFCLKFPKRTILLFFVLPVPAWIVGLMVIVVNVVGFSNADAPVAYDVHLVGAVFALAYDRFKWNFGRLSISVPNPKRLFKPRPKLRLHDPEVAYHEMDSEADDLLAKVRRSGVESLSTAERVKLEDYSRRMRQKHR